MLASSRLVQVPLVTDTASWSTKGSPSPIYRLPPPGPIPRGKGTASWGGGGGGARGAGGPGHRGDDPLLTGTRRVQVDLGPVAVGRHRHRRPDLIRRRTVSRSPGDAKLAGSQRQGRRAVA